MKVPLFEYREAKKTTHVLLEAVHAGERGEIAIRLKDTVHFSYLKGVLDIKIDKKTFTETFKSSLMHYNIAYVTEATYNKYLEEIKNLFLGQLVPRRSAMPVFEDSYLDD